jgi:hypothetical protein
MDFLRHKVFVGLIFTMIMYYIILKVVAIQHVALSYHHFMLDVVELIALNILVTTPRKNPIWKHEKLNEYMEQHLFETT